MPHDAVWAGGDGDVAALAWMRTVPSRNGLVATTAASSTRAARCSASPAKSQAEESCDQPHRASAGDDQEGHRGQKVQPDEDLVKQLGGRLGIQARSEEAGVPGAHHREHSHEGQS